MLYVVGAGQVDQETVRTATASLGAAAPKALAYVINRAARPRRYGYHKYYQTAGSESWAQNSLVDAPGADLARFVQEDTAENDGEAHE